MKKINKKGFTLGELMVTVAIIAVLTALSLPIYITQLEKSRRRVDENRIKNAVTLAETAYMKEKTTEERTYIYDARTGSIVSETPAAGYGEAERLTYDGITYEPKGKFLVITVQGDTTSISWEEVPVEGDVSEPEVTPETTPEPSPSAEPYLENGLPTNLVEENAITWPDNIFLSNGESFSLHRGDVIVKDGSYYFIVSDCAVYGEHGGVTLGTPGAYASNPSNWWAIVEFSGTILNDDDMTCVWGSCVFMTVNPGDMYVSPNGRWFVHKNGTMTWQQKPNENNSSVEQGNWVEIQFSGVE